jgi:N-acetylated-alpha-linked acidic dipeptidase
MTRRLGLSCLFVLAFVPAALPAQTAGAQRVFGYRNFSAQQKIEARFLAVPSAKMAGEHLKALTAEPHLAASPEDRRVAEYVARKFRAAGLQTEMVPYRVLLNRPKAVRVEAWDEEGKLLMSGPTRERVAGDRSQDDPRVVMPFHGSSGSGDLTAEAVYANYGRIEDYDQLAARHIDLHGKIVLVRYGANFRGVKVYLAEQRGAAGVLIYSDPQDDGYGKGEVYPEGPWRPATGVQRGSVQFIFKYPGDPQTPGVASTLKLPDSARLPANKTGNQPHIVSIPIGYGDAAPILQAMKGPVAPQEWQGGLPFRYRLGPGGVKVHLISRQDYRVRTIWDVIGKVKGKEFPDEWVIAGSHHDAWVYGAVDPGSGGASMLEAVHGIGALLKQGWRPKRTLVFASWDAEEEGLIGSTEWVEDHAKELEHAVAYFNTDMAVSGPEFAASAVPSLKRFLRELTRSVFSPLGGSVYQQWSVASAGDDARREAADSAEGKGEVKVGDLGSGSDFTPFFQHAGVPSTDIESSGPYGVYHSVFDNYAWFVQNADPHFKYLQQMARVFGLEALRMADADALPYDYAAYAREIATSLEAAKRRAAEDRVGPLDFGPALAASARLTAAAGRVYALQTAATGNLARLNRALRQTETAFLSDAGLPGRPWYKHTVFAPGERTGYAAVILPGVNEAIDARDTRRAARQLTALAQSLERAARALNSAQ